MLFLLLSVTSNKTSLVLNTGKGWMEHQLQGCTPVLCDRVHITENMCIIGTWPSVFNCTPMMTLRATGAEESAGCNDVRTSNETWSSLRFTWVSPASCTDVTTFCTSSALYTSQKVNCSYISGISEHNNQRFALIWDAPPPYPNYSDINMQLHAQNISHKVCRTLGCYCLSHFDEKFYINIRLLINRRIVTSTSHFTTLYSIHSHEPHSRLLPPLENTKHSCLALDFVHRGHQSSRPFIISREGTWKKGPPAKMSGQRRHLAANNGGRWLHKRKW